MIFKPSFFPDEVREMQIRIDEIRTTPGGNGASEGPSEYYIYGTEIKNNQSLVIVTTDTSTLFLQSLYGKVEVGKIYIMKCQRETGWKYQELKKWQCKTPTLTFNNNRYY